MIRLPAHWKYERDIKNLRRECERRLRALKSEIEKNRQETRFDRLDPELGRQYYDLASTYMEKIKVAESKRLIAIAETFGIPVPYDWNDPELWREGKYAEGRMMTYEAEVKLLRAIREKRATDQAQALTSRGPQSVTAPIRLLSRQVTAVCRGLSVRLL